MLTKAVAALFIYLFKIQDSNLVKYYYNLKYI